MTTSQSKKNFELASVALINGDLNAGQLSFYEGQLVTLKSDENLIGVDSFITNNGETREYNVLSTVEGLRLPLTPFLRRGNGLGLTGNTKQECFQEFCKEFNGNLLKLCIKKVITVPRGDGRSTYIFLEKM